MGLGGAVAKIIAYANEYLGTLLPSDVALIFGTAFAIIITLAVWRIVS